MLRFFSKIRYKLAAENKIAKYLRYAIGEILLVVIGIIIALQVSNWNTERVLRHKEVVYLKSLKKSLEQDLENEIIPAIEYHEKGLMCFDTLLTMFFQSESWIPKDSIQKWNITYGSLRLFQTSFNTVAFENIKSIGIDFISNDSLREEISTLYGYDYEWIDQITAQLHTSLEERFFIVWDREVGNIFQLTDEEWNILRKNSQLHVMLIGIQGKLNNINYYMELAQQKVENLISDLDNEIEHLDD